MPSSCSAPGCRSNYDSDDRIPIFTMPENPPELNVRNIFEMTISRLFTRFPTETERSQKYHVLNLS